MFELQQNDSPHTHLAAVLSYKLQLIMKRDSFILKVALRAFFSAFSWFRVDDFSL